MRGSQGGEGEAWGGGLIHNALVTPSWSPGKTGAGGIGTIKNYLEENAPQEGGWNVKKNLAKREAGTISRSN